jgi:Tfp pilus assembly protein PilN
MALRLNLYHEIHKAKALKRRDPLKISIYSISAIAALFASWYFVQVVRMHALNDQYMKIKAEFEKVEPMAKAAKKKEDELAQKAATSVLIGKRIESRFYWAPLLAELTQVVPREVQITRLGGEVTGDSARHCTLTIDGLSAGGDPRHVAEDLRTAIAEHLAPHYKSVTSTFKTLEDGSEMVMLDGRQVGTATFAIVVQVVTTDEKSSTPSRKKR